MKSKRVNYRQGEKNFENQILNMDTEPGFNFHVFKIPHYLKTLPSTHTSIVDAATGCGAFHPSATVDRFGPYASSP